MSSDPQQIKHVRGTEKPFGLRVLRDGDPYDFSGLTVVAGLEWSEYSGLAAGGTTVFKQWPMTAHGATGTLSGTIPYTGISFTGDATLRIWVSGSPRQFIGKSLAVKVTDLSANFVP